MNSKAETTAQNPLATANINSLIAKFAIPAVISMLVSAMYNIVDQIFIGQGVGILGNAATNVAFPLTTICTALALLFGIGTASNFNLEMGRGNQEKAGKIAGNGVVLMIATGIVMGVVVLLFLEPLLKVFGATDQVLPYALTYTGITAFGLPFFVLQTGGCHIIRADGSPKYAMACMLTGAIINTILDPIFIFVFNMGIAGAALATIIGQIISAIMILLYFRNFKTMKLTGTYLKLDGAIFKAIVSLGTASCFNQLAMTVTQIVMNNVLTRYGASSIYGSEIPLACVGIITKVNVVYISFIVGTSQGCQPIFGFNYGAKNYERVKQTYLSGAKAVTIMSLIAFLCFQIFPRQITSIFGDGSEEYYLFAMRYFRIFLMLTFLNGIQPLTANFFTSIGKATKGLFISLTRQIIFLVPLILIFPMFMGIDGVMYAGPIADTISAILAVLFMTREFRLMSQLIEKESPACKPAKPIYKG